MFPFVDRDPALDTFSGRAPLFPLPNAVLFPQAILPLHIFEPRYRQMTADALVGEQLIAMALKTGDPGAVPPLHDVVGLGKIIAHQRLDDGRYHLVLRGLARARIAREVASDRMYRVAELQLLDDQISPDFDQQEGIRQLLRQFARSFPSVQGHPVWQSVEQNRVPLGAVCDLLASALPISPPIAMKFLADCDVCSRYQALMEALEHVAARRTTPPEETLTTLRRQFPPPFSEN